MYISVEDGATEGEGKPGENVRQEPDRSGQGNQVEGGYSAAHSPFYFFLAYF